MAAKKAGNAPGATTELVVGAKAPAFTLKDQHGEKVALTGFKDHRVFLFFYPKAMTPG